MTAARPITSNPDIMGGEWCIAGTRIPARGPRDFHDAGHDARDIIKEYPTLTPDDIAAAIAFRPPDRPTPRLSQTEVGETAQAVLLAQIRWAAALRRAAIVRLGWGRAA